MPKVIIVEVIIPSVGGFDVFISHSYEEEMHPGARAKHFRDFKEVLEYINEKLKEWKKEVLE